MKDFPAILRDSMALSLSLANAIKRPKIAIILIMSAVTFI